MFEQIGYSIQKALKDLSFVSFAGGYAELLDTTGDEERVKYPASKEFKNGVWSGDYESLLPDGEERCIVFTDSQTDITVSSSNARYSVLIIRFRVVVWFDERKIEFEDSDQYGDKMARVMQEIINTVPGVKFPDFMKSRTVFESINADPLRIWAAYAPKPDDALFMAPYRTFAVTFRTTAWLANGCKLPTIENVNACY